MNPEEVAELIRLTFKITMMNFILGFCIGGFLIGIYLLVKNLIK